MYVFCVQLSCSYRRRAALRIVTHTSSATARAMGRGIGPPHTTEILKTLWQRAPIHTPNTRPQIVSNAARERARTHTHTSRKNTHTHTTPQA